MPSRESQTWVPGDTVPGASPASHAHVLPRSSQIGLSLRASFLFLAIFMLAVFHASPWMKTLSLTFVSIVLEAFPFMLLGSMISGFIEVFVSKDRLAAVLPGRRVLLTMISAGMGMVLPVCECAIVPVVRRFLRKGIPLSAAVAYLLAGPIFNPVVGASTAVAYSSNQGWQTAAIVAIRLGSGFLIAAGIGLFVGRLFPGGTALAGGAAAASDNACAHTHPAKEGEGPPGIKIRVLAALNHSVDDFLDVAQYLVMGAFIAGLLQTAISRQAFLDLAGLPLLAVPLMMLLAVLLNLCSEADAFIAASFRGALPLSGQMAFMVLGPMLDIKLILMYLSVFRKRAIIALALLVFLAVLALMLLLHALLGPWYVNPAGIAPAL